MTSMQQFDYDDYVRGFREACAQRGIDPLNGATGYQVVHFVAEKRRMARKPDRWWAKHEFWMDCPPYRSETEEAAIWELFGEAYLLTVLRVLRAKRRWQAAMSLREVHECQRRGIK